MKRYGKRLLSLLLMLCLMMGLCAPAWAASSESSGVEANESGTDSDVPYQYEVTVDQVKYRVTMEWSNGKYDIPSDAVVIGYEAGITSAVIPENLTWRGYQVPVKRIWSRAFENCTTLTDITMSSQIIELHPYAFKGCTALRSVQFSDNNNIPIINSDTFWGCTSLTHIDLPEGVTKIDRNAFRDSGLQSITLPSSLTSILGGAFYGCTSLTEVIVKGQDLSFMSNGDFPSSAVFYAPAGATGYEYLEKNNMVLVSGEPEPKFSLTLDKQICDLGTASVSNYSGRYSDYEETVTVTNTSEKPVKIEHSSFNSEHFFIQFRDTSYSNTLLDPGESATFFVLPKYDLEPGVYEDQYTITTNRSDRGATVTGTARFTIVGTLAKVVVDGPSTVDFGSRKEGEWIGGQKVTLKNISEDSAPLQAPVDTEHFEVGTMSVPSLNPGASLFFYVGPKEGLKPGTYTDTLTIYMRDGSVATTVQLRCTITAADAGLTVSPASLSFGNVQEGYSQPSAQTVTVKNTGTGTLTLQQPTSSNYTIGSLSRTSLSANQTAIFSVRPKAGLKAGTYNETLTVKSSDGKASGTVSLTFTVTGETGLTVSPASLSFGSVQEDYNQPSAQTVTVKNTGTGTLTLQQPASSNYTIGSLSRTSLTANQTATFTVRPKAGLKAGTYKETLTVRSTDGKATGSVSLTFTVAAKGMFSDVKTTDWFYEDVKYVNDKGLMSGMGNNQFSPNRTTTRGQIVTILYRLEGEPSVSGGSSFSDVPSGQWYSNAVAWASANGIVNGVGGGKFAPGNPITREQMAAILYRYASYKKYDVSKRADLSGYTDLNQVGSYAVDAFAWANGEGLISGMGGGKLAPKGSATRAQVAAILHRFSEGVAE